MTLASWIYFTTTGWWIWVGVAGLFSAYVVWVRTTRPRQSFVPLIFLALWLAGSIAYYVLTHWHHYLAQTFLWFTGVVSILVVAAVPLAVTFALERVTSPIIRNQVLRAVLAASVGILVTLSIQRPLGLWVRAWWSTCTVKACGLTRRLQLAGA